MTYEPRKYWPARLAVEGESYVAFEGRSAQFSHQHKVFTEALDGEFDRIPKPERILDFGCGVGRFSPYLEGKCDYYYGADINKAAMPKEHPSNCEFLFLEEDRIPLDDDTVDVVCSITVLQHIVSEKDWKTWTSELSRVLKPTGAYLLIDNVLLGNPAPHMNPRGPSGIAEGLGAKMEHSRLISAESKHSHWVMTLKPS